MAIVRSLLALWMRWGGFRILIRKRNEFSYSSSCQYSWFYISYPTILSPKLCLLLSSGHCHLLTIYLTALFSDSWLYLLPMPLSTPVTFHSDPVYFLPPSTPNSVYVLPPTTKTPDLLHFLISAIISPNPSLFSTQPHDFCLLMASATWWLLPIAFTAVYQLLPPYPRGPCLYASCSKYTRLRTLEVVCILSSLAQSVDRVLTANWPPTWAVNS